MFHSFLFVSLLFYSADLPCLPGHSDWVRDYFSGLLVQKRGANQPPPPCLAARPAAAGRLKRLRPGHDLRLGSDCKHA